MHHAHRTGHLTYRLFGNTTGGTSQKRAITKERADTPPMDAGPLSFLGPVRLQDGCAGPRNTVPLK